MSNSKSYFNATSFSLVIALTLSMALPAFSQTASSSTGNGCNLVGAPAFGLRSPLVAGSSMGLPFVPAPEGLPPATGDGPTGAPVIPGHSGPSTLLPWVPSVPANTIGQGSSGIPIPFSPAIQTPPGVLGPLMTGLVPAPPSTPGCDPGMMQAPMGSFNPALQTPINPDGGIPGRGGYCTTIPTVRRGGQETRQYELRGRNSALGGIGGDGSQDQVNLLGPMAGYGVPFGVATGNGMRNSSIDLGGGQRFSVGGQTISTASTVQDFGNSATRYNGISALTANQATEFGQGMRRIPVYSNKTTDFGFPYTQFSPSNVPNQKRSQLLLPKAVVTNF
ncbi:MAG: hypothetical protein K2X27_26685 [Candidatus Obscuribacterales bacterium]|nr:hypothetical protein [Candidatus Obscuribacterales bacterium]